MRPLRAKIHMNENMEEHRKYKVRCAVFGSKPEPRIEWFINGEKIINQYTTVRYYSHQNQTLVTWTQGPGYLLKHNSRSQPLTHGYSLHPTPRICKKILRGT